MDLRGLFAPLPAPFTDDASTVSEVRLSRVLRHLCRLEVDGFIACADAGEFFTCAFGERKSIVEFAVRDSLGKPVLVNVSAMSTPASIDLAQHASRHGARAVIAQAPSVYPLTDDEVAGYFHRLARHGGMSVIVVDPQNRCNETVRSKLADVQGLNWALPYREGMFGDGRTHSDEFICDGITATPAAAIRPEAVKIPEHLALFRELASGGSARLLKTALEIQDLDCGPHRGPLQGLTAEMEHTLRSVLRQTHP